MDEEFNLEPIKRVKLSADDGIPYEDRPIVFHGRSVYVFIDKCPRPLNKFLKDVCNPISKPQKVHEYMVEESSLVRAQALGYKKQAIIQTFEKNMQNKGKVPSQIEHLIRSCVRESDCEMVLAWNNQTCYYQFTIDRNLYLGVRDIFANNLEQDKQQFANPQIKCLVFKVKKFEHIDLQQKLLKKGMPVKSDRIVRDFQPQTKKLKGARHVSYCHNIQINLKSFTQLREYQAEALNAIVKVDGNVTTAKSGYVVLPCGAGKTLLGISILCKVKKQTMIVCSNDSGTEQWKREIQKWTQSFPREEIIIITSENKFQFKNSAHGQIFISTYSFLKEHVNSKKGFKKMDEWLINKPWGLIIFDECQTLPAQLNKQIVVSMMAQVKIGLTATPMRQDDQIKALSYMVGPQLYVGDWKTFVEQGYLANPKCIQIRTELTDFFKRKYQRQIDKLPQQKQKRRRQLCYNVNPNKIKALLFLLRHHEKLDDHILVFSDSVEILRYLAAKLKRPVLEGSAKAEQRMFIFDMFRQGKIRTLFLSRIGDEAVDLPNANVGIQLNIQHGSRKQMLQRLGRIMRQKQASSSMSYNAMFYTITTYKTSQWTHFFKRYKCLIDQGFHYDLRLFEFKPNEENIDNILTLDLDVRQQIQNQYKRIVGNEEQYWNYFYTANN